MRLRPGGIGHDEMNKTRPSNSVFWLLALAAAVALAWRPFVLGFYMDDWFHLIVPDLTTPALSWERWAQTEVTQNRPVFRFLAVLLHAIIPLNTAAWHVWIVILILATATSMALAFRSLLMLQFECRIATQAAAIGAVFWLAFPFAVPNAFWPTASTAFFSIIALCLSVFLMTERWWSTQAWPYIAVFATSLFGYLTYEAIYFQLIPILGFLAVQHGWRTRRTTVWMLVVIVPQVATLAFNRYMRAIGAEGSRGFNTNFLEAYFWWFGLPERTLGMGLLSWQVITTILFTCLLILLFFVYRHDILSASVTGRQKNLVKTVTFAGLATAAAAATVTFPMSFLETAVVVLPLAGFLGIAAIRTAAELEHTIRNFALFLALLALALICLSALAFAAGNFVMWAVGMGGRVSIIVNVWIALLIALAAAVLISRIVWRRTVAISAIALWCALMVGTFFRAAEWHGSWTLQKATLAAAPTIDTTEIDPGAAFVYSGPEHAGSIPAIETEWHMGAFATAAFLGQANDDAAWGVITGWTHRWLVSRVEKFQITWDGGNLVRRLCEDLDAINLSIPAEEVWVWNGWEESFTLAQSGSVWGCSAGPQS